MGEGKSFGPRVGGKGLGVCGVRVGTPCPLYPAPAPPTVRNDSESRAGGGGACVTMHCSFLGSACVGREDLPSKRVVGKT